MSGEVLSQAEVESLLSAMDGRGADAVPHARRRSAAAPREGHAVRLQAARARRQGADAGAADDARRLRPQFRRGPLGPAADDRRGEAHQRRSAHLQRIRLQPRESDLLQPDQRRAARRAVDSRHQSCRLLYPIIDRLLGGGSEPTPPIRRPLTEIELRLVSRITDLFLRGDEARLGERARLEAVGRPRREQSAARADRAAERSGRADQLRADAGRRPRHDEPVHPVQLDRADQRAAHVEQLGRLRQEAGRRRRASSGSATSSPARWSKWWSTWRRRTSPRPT